MLFKNSRALEKNDVRKYGAVVGGANCYPAYVAAKAVVGTGPLRFIGSPGDVYALNIPNEADLLEGPLFDVDDGVIIRIVQADGLDAKFGSGSIRVVRSTRVHQMPKDVYYQLSPQSTAHVQERVVWPTLAEADKTRWAVIDCEDKNEVAPRKLAWDTEGDAFEDDVFSAITPASFSCNTAGAGYAHLGMVRVAPGQGVWASFKDFHNTLSTLFIVVRCESEYHGAYGGNQNGALTTFSKKVGVARPAPVARVPETAVHASNFPLASQVTVKVRDSRNYDICLNGIAVVSGETESDILEVGFGNYPAELSTLVVENLVRSYDAPALNGVASKRLAVFSDSNGAGDGFQHVYGSWVEQLRRNFDGVAGMRLLPVRNLSVSGATSGSMLASVTPENLAGVDGAVFGLGTNDQQGAVAVATYLANMEAMFDVCIAERKPIFGVIPPMYYDRAAANDRGNATTNFALGAPYRSGLMRLCAEKNVIVVDSLGGLGSIVSTHLDPALSLNPTIYDNVHLDFMGATQMALKVGYAVLGYFARNHATSERNIPLPETGLTGGATFVSKPPRYSVDHLSKQTVTNGCVDVPAGLLDDAELYTLPEKLWPEFEEVFFCRNSEDGVSALIFGTDGVVTIKNPPALAGWVSFSTLYFKR